MPHAAPDALPAPEIRVVTAPGRARCFEVSGAWNLRGLESRLAELAPRLAEYVTETGAAWDLRGIDMLDHAGAMVLWRAWGRRRVANLTLKSEHEAVFHHLDIPAEPTVAGAARDPLWPVVMVGRKVLKVLDHLATMVAVLGQVVLDAVYLIRQPAPGLP